MTIDERRQYLRIMQLRYLEAGRAERSALLNEMAKVTGMHRKSLTRLLHSDLQRHPRRHQRGARYGPEGDEALVLIAKSLDYVIPFLRKHYPQLILSRSRPYHKNDNRNVEQKNRTLVRDFLSDRRLDTVQQTRYLNRLYELMGRYYNFFLPVMHLVAKDWLPATDQQPGHLRRRHDRSRPPLLRLCERGAHRHPESRPACAATSHQSPGIARLHLGICPIAYSATLVPRPVTPRVSIKRWRSPSYSRKP